MKTKLSTLLAISLISVSPAFAQKVEIVVGDMNNDGRLTIEDVTLLTSTLLGDREEQHLSCRIEHAYVDLGLPSGTLWATCNVGASKPEQYGDYFGWGETTPQDTKGNYSWATYFDYSGSGFITYNNDGKTELAPENDAATVVWGAEWCMPTFAQIDELYNSNYTTSVWTTQGEVNGYLITSKKNKNSIFLPAAGQYAGNKLQYVTEVGKYWTRSLDTSSSNAPYFLYLRPTTIDYNEYGTRFYGYSVRPVRVTSK